MIAYATRFITNWKGIKEKSKDVLNASEIKILEELLS